MGVTMLVTRRIAAGSSVNSTLSSAIFLRVGLSILSVSAVMIAGGPEVVPSVNSF
jgi:hypothetical protein